MTPFIILPVKPLATGKSRLAGAMGAAGRRAFNRTLVDHVLRVGIAVAGADRMIVVSRDGIVLDLARNAGAQAVGERGDAGLNTALDQATEEATRRGADSVLVLPVDLPLLAPADIEAMIAAAAGKDRTAVIAPDRRDAGTNGLLLAPPAVVPFAFGPDSFKVHLAAARRAGIEPVIVRRDALSFDVDTAEDLNVLAARVPDPATG